MLNFMVKCSATVTPCVNYSTCNEICSFPACHPEGGLRSTFHVCSSGDELIWSCITKFGRWATVHKKRLPEKKKKRPPVQKHGAKKLSCNDDDAKTMQRPANAGSCAQLHRAHPGNSRAAQARTPLEPPWNRPKLQPTTPRTRIPYAACAVPKKSGSHGYPSTMLRDMLPNALSCLRRGCDENCLHFAIRRHTECHGKNATIDSVRGEKTLLTRFSV